MVCVFVPFVATRLFVDFFFSSFVSYREMRETIMIHCDGGFVGEKILSPESNWSNVLQCFSIRSMLLQRFQLQSSDTKHANELFFRFNLVEVMDGRVPR